MVHARSSTGHIDGDRRGDRHKQPSWLDLFYSLISFIPMLAILVRRLHDTQCSGWWAWVFVIPVIGPFWLIYLLVQPSSSHFTDKALLS